MGIDKGKRSTSRRRTHQPCFNHYCFDCRIYNESIYYIGIAFTTLRENQCEFGAVASEIGEITNSATVFAFHMNISHIYIESANSRIWLSKFHAFYWLNYFEGSWYVHFQWILQKQSTPSIIWSHSSSDIFGKDSFEELRILATLMKER